MPIKPRDFDAMRTWGLGSSGFRNTECDIVARNVLLLQRHLSLESWTPFTWEDYVSFCTHRAADDERQVLDALVYGGRPVWNTSCHLSPGFLAKYRDEYLVTRRFIGAIAFVYAAGADVD